MSIDHMPQNTHLEIANKNYIQLKSNLSALGHPKITTTNLTRSERRNLRIKNKFAQAALRAMRMLQEIIIMHLTTECSTGHFI